MNDSASMATRSDIITLEQRRSSSQSAATQMNRRSPGRATKFRVQLSNAETEGATPQHPPTFHPDEQTGIVENAQDLLQGKLNAVAKSIRISSLIPRRSRYTQDSIGRLLRTVPGYYQIWEIIGPALDAQRELQKEIDYCVWHAYLPKTVYRFYCMVGLSEQFALATVIIWGGDKRTRKQAKKRIQDEVFIERKYDDWNIRLAESNPIIPNPISLMLRQTSKGQTIIHHEERSCLSFWKHVRSGICVVRRAINNDHVLGVISGPFAIDGRYFYFSSAHVLTGKSATPPGFTNHNQASVSSENLFDSSDDDTDDALSAIGDGPEAPDKEKPSRSSSVTSSRQSSESPTMDPTSPPTPSRLGESYSTANHRTSSQLRYAYDDDDMSAFVELNWPKANVTVKLGSSELDYALIEASPSPEFFENPNHTNFRSLPWDLPLEQSNYPPRGNINILTTERGVLHGSFLSTPMSFNTSECSETVHFWVYWPDVDPVSGATNPRNGVLPGDSGALVYGAWKYGYVIAGDPNTGAAIVVPSHLMYTDIQIKFGTPQLISSNPWQGLANFPSDAPINPTNKAVALSPSAIDPPMTFPRNLTASLQQPSERREHVSKIESARNVTMPDTLDHQREKANELPQHIYIFQGDARATERSREHMERYGIPKKSRPITKHKVRKQYTTNSSKFKHRDKGLRRREKADLGETSKLGQEAVNLTQLGPVNWAVRLWNAKTGGEITRLSGHESEVTAVALSPDGQTLASGSHDASVRFWNATTGIEISRLRGHHSWITSIAFSPDGTVVASGSLNNTIKLWDTATGGPIRLLLGHDSSISGVAFSPDGQKVISGSHDKTVRLWNTATGKELLQLIGHESEVTTVAFSPDGQTAVSGSHKKTVRLWNTATGEELLQFKGHESEVTTVAFSPDGKMVVSGSHDKTVQLWDTATAERLFRLTGHTGPITLAAFSPDGLTIMSGSQDGSVMLWNTATGEEVTRLGGYGPGLAVVAFSPDGRTVASAPMGHGNKLLWMK